jgi:hypothetical protein
MDPNEALERIRSYADSIRDGLDNDLLTVTELTASIRELLDYFHGLDEWLCKGGFLPDAWQRP